MKMNKIILILIINVFYVYISKFFDINMNFYLFL